MESSIVYATPIPNTKTANSSAIYRAVGYQDKLVENSTPAYENIWEMFEDVVSKYKDNAFLGTRVKYDDGSFGPYIWKTYSQIKTLVLQIGSGLEYLKAVEEKTFENCEFQQNFKFLGIYSKNREEWNVTDLASAAFGYTLVPLYDTLGSESLKLILSKTKMSAIVANGECTEKLLKLQLNEFPHLKYIITLDTPKTTDMPPNITMIHWIDLKNHGAKNPVSLSNIKTPKNYEANTISFTSGTTGEPKGAILSHINFLSAIGGLNKGVLSEEQANLCPDDVIISYLPLSHIYERIVEFAFAQHGAKIGYYSGDVLKIVDDLGELCPTVFASVPRLFSRIYDKIMAGIESKPFPIKFAVKYAIQSKINKIHKGGPPTHKLFDNIFFGRMRNILGGNCRMVISGSAPLPLQLQTTMKIMFSLPVMQGYGLTETMGGSFVAHPDDHILGHIGGPIPSIEYKVVSVDNMNYHATDKLPKGELCVRGKTISKGYFLNEEAQKASYDEDGWFYTGDIVEVQPNGSICVIDRRKDIFKLAQGEYLIPEKIEGILSQSLFVDQLYITGLSTEQFAVGVVIPNQQASESFASKANIDYKNFNDLCANNQFKQKIMQEFQTIGKQKGLLGFEIPKNIIIETNPFSVDNDFLTPSFKMKRPNLFSHYKNDIQNLYKN